MEIDSEPNDKSTEARIVLRGGGSLVSCKPVFTPDSRYLLYGSGHSVKVSSVVTGECIKVLKGHTSAVTSILINPANQFQALTSSNDKSVIKWDIQDGILLARYKFYQPITSLYPSKLTNEVSLFYAVQFMDEQRNSLVKFSLPKTSSSSSSEMVKTETVVRDVSDASNLNDVGCQGHYIATASIRTLKILDTRNNKTSEFRWDGRHKFTCVTCHPTEYCVATGLSDGRIVLWRNFLSSSSASEGGKVMKTVLQWHALPVKDLSFTAEGASLLSGGYECVLVKWHTVTLKRETYPRLGAPLCYVSASSDNQMYATCHSDNGIQIISNTFKVLQLFQGLVQGYRDQQVKCSRSAGLLLDKRTGALVANGRPGQLQFYHPHKDEQLFCLDITGQNYVSPEDLKQPLVLTEVERADVSDSCDWLVTYERRSDGVVTDEMRLKFWSYSVQEKTYVLNTTVNMPHSRQVETIQFRPAKTGSDKNDDDDDGLLVVTTSSDGTFKLWRLVDDTDIYRTNEKWSCDSIGSYHNLPAGPASFSQDGSVLAVGFRDALTLWNPSTNTLTFAVSLGEKFCIRRLVFGREGASQMLFITIEERLMAWNILNGCGLAQISELFSLQYMMTASYYCMSFLMLQGRPCYHLFVEYSIAQDVSQILPVPNSDSVAIFTKKNSLIVFNGSTGKVIYERSDICQGAIMAAIFVPAAQSGEGELSWMGLSRLYFLTESQELLTLINSGEEEESSATQYATLDHHTPMTAFSALISAESRRKEKVKRSGDEWVERTNQQDKQFYSELISTPLHVLPPLTGICYKFMETLMLKQKNTQISTEDAESESDDDTDDDVESDESDDDDDDKTQQKQSTSYRKTDKNLAEPMET